MKIPVKPNPEECSCKFETWIVGSEQVKLRLLELCEKCKQYQIDMIDYIKKASKKKGEKI